MHQRDLRREAEVNELQRSLEDAKSALIQKDAERIVQAEQVEQLTRAYQQRTSTGSQRGSSDERPNYFDLSSRCSAESHPGVFATLAAGVYNPFAGAFAKPVGSEVHTTAQCTKVGGSHTSKVWTFPFDLAATNELSATQTMTQPTIVQSQPSASSNQPAPAPTPVTNNGQLPKGVHRALMGGATLTTTGTGTGTTTATATKGGSRTLGGITVHRLRRRRQHPTPTVRSTTAQATT